MARAIAPRRCARSLNAADCRSVRRVSSASLWAASRLTNRALPFGAATGRGVPIGTAGQNTSLRSATETPVWRKCACAARRPSPLDGDTWSLESEQPRLPQDGADSFLFGRRQAHHRFAHAAGLNNPKELQRGLESREGPVRVGLPACALAGNAKETN